MTLILDFQGQFKKKSYLRNGMADWHGIERMWVERMLDPCCDFQFPPHPWPWSRISLVKFWKSLILWMGRPIDMEPKGGMWVDRMLDPCCDFQCSPLPWPWPWIFLDFQGQILKNSYLRNGMTDWHGAKGMWVNRMLDSHCDFKLRPQPWPWPWIFKVKYWNSCNSGMGGLTHLECKGCDLDMMLDTQWDWPWATVHDK